MTHDESLNNRTILSEEAIHLIVQDFGRYQDPIPHAVVNYLVNGGDDHVLQQLQSRYMPWPDERSVQAHNWPPAPSYGLRSQLLHCLTTQDIEFYDRLTRTYAAEAENLQWYRPLSLDWLSLFLFCLIDPGRITGSLEQPLALPPAITANLIESLLLRGGESADKLAQLVFLADLQQVEPQRDAVWRAAWIGASLPEFRTYSLKHESVIQTALTHPALEQRVHALEMLTLGQLSPEPFASLLVDRATATSKIERATALPLLQRDAIAMTPVVQAKAQSGKATERAHAARLLLDLAGAEMRGFLEDRLHVEQTASVRDAIAQVLTDLATLNAPEAEITLSPLPPVGLEAPLPPSARDGIHAVLIQLYESAQATYEAQQYQQYPDVPLPLPPAAEFVDRVYHSLQFGTASECLAIAPIYHYLAHGQAAAQFRQLLQIPELEVIHVVRLLLLLQILPIESQVFPPHETIPRGMHWKESEINADLQRWCQQRQPDSSLRYLTASFEALGIPGETIAWKLLTWEESPFWTWGDRAIGEYFAEHLPILDSLFELGPFPQIHSTHEQSARRQLFRILALLPTLPVRVIPPLWEMALNGGQAEMPLAQRCLDHRPGTPERLHQLVAHGDPAIQLTVIPWLTQLQDPTAISLFQAALRRQPTAAVRDVLLRALEKLGASIDEFLDRRQLLQEAQVGLQKGIPNALSWFPFDALPPVHWQDTAAPVAPEILTWFVVQSYQQKNPEPSPVWRQYAKLWHETERQQFGQIVLERWIHQDTQAKSAVKEKGILSVAGACGGAAMVPVINHYLKTHFGKRLPQCLALLQMLTWSDDFAAIQLLLAIANRFRTQKIQQAAQQCVHQLAERQGWTLAELGDRTIPWCGLAEDGTFGLDYGARQFTAVLSADCKLSLSDSAGNILNALPAARKDDDAEQVKAAKQQWTATKKQLELVVSQQQARLYEALCTQRSWIFSDWELFLHQHPVVGRLCQRLLWAVFANDSAQPIQTFHPQPNQTLVDAEATAVTVSPTAIVRLAQATVLPQALTQAWQQYWRTTQLTPLFDSWAVVYSPPVASAEMTAISDFAGRSLSRHLVRQRALQRGYLPHTEEFEQGWITSYRKRFESMDLEAVLGISGDSPISQEVFEVQIQDLYFWQGRQLSIAEVPPVLLSIVWHEIQAITAADA